MPVDHDPNRRLVNFHPAGGRPTLGLILDFHFNDPKRSVCLIAWCRQTKAWAEHIGVPHGGYSTADQDHWHYPGEAETSPTPAEET